MRRNPALTFSGALKILDKYESKTVRRLDKALGGIILAAGAGTGIAVVDGAALAPLAAAVWGWVDQKNEAMSLLRELTGKLSPLVRQTKGLERRQLIAAAHSTIAIAAFLDVLEEHGEKAPTDVIGVGRRTKPEDIVEYLYSAEIPAPSTSVGFAENLTRVNNWAILLCDEFGLTMGFPAGEVVERYESYYLGLAESAPEFTIWMMHGEHAATRTRTAQLDDAFQLAFAVQGEALARVESLLERVARVAGKRDAVGRHHDGLRAANLGVLGQPIVPHDAERYDTAVTFPTVREAFRTPRYQITTMGREVRPASETWWQERPVADDFDAMITSYLTSPNATQLPLLLLGHPGAGKSLLTKVLAARLPAVDYTVVRVPLRNVGAGAPIVHQIEQALDKATNGHVQWRALVDEPTDAVLVVLLDGLDELLQATAVDRRGYLQEALEFQRIEGEQNRPVVVVVTSRTVVADRVDIPAGTTMVKLADFDDDQIAAWLDTWRATNQTGIDAGVVGELTLTEAHHQIDLARQPLLLLMLVLYAADPKSPKLDAGLSTSALYQRIFDNFARREVQKRASTPLHGTDLEDAVADQVLRLSIAALAMFNRGVQHVKEAGLRTDLSALRQEEVAAHQGRRLLGEFFFVHAAEGVTEETERSYEFLHATFGEYLVARHVLDELVDVATAAYSGRRGREPNDQMLFALLSHQVWAARPDIREFAFEIFAALPNADRDNVRRVLAELIGDYRQRQRSAALDRYRPTPVDFVRQPAAYSANLVTLAVAFAGANDFGLVGPFGDTDDQARAAWRSTLALWQAGLDEDSWLSVLNSFDLVDGLVVVGVDSGLREADVAQYWFARLSDDADDARRSRFGVAITEGVLLSDNWTDSVLSSVYLGILEGRVGPLPLRYMPHSTSSEEIAAVENSLALLLRVRAARMSSGSVADIVHWLTRDPRIDVALTVILVVIYHHPDVLLTTPRWQNPGLYAGRLDELHVVLDEAASRLVSEHRLEWQRIRTRLLGGDLPEKAGAGGKKLTASLIDMVTWMNNAPYPIEFRRGGPGPAHR